MATTSLVSATLAYIQKSRVKQWFLLEEFDAYLEDYPEGPISNHSVRVVRKTLLK